MGEKVISRADLGAIEKNLKYLSNAVSTINGNMAQLDNNINAVNSNVALVDDKLEDLYTKFNEFIQNDAKVKEIQLAETRMVKVRQEIEKKFGHYDELRRHTTGILQAVDTGIIRMDTIKTATEELMLNAPNYWLAPCLVSLSAWISDNKTLAERALNDAMKRNDEKTSLFFALVSRRIERYDACEAWIRRYFEMQDPYNLEREMVVIIDAYSSGLFGPDNKSECGEKIIKWLKEVKDNDEIVEVQRKKWREYIKSKKTKGNHDQYKYLSKYSNTWNSLEESLDNSKLHEGLMTYFRGIFDGEIEVSPNVVVALDDLLMKLVTEFDKEELPLRNKELELECIIEANGDKNAAMNLVSRKKDALKEYVTFAQLLTNISISREETKASKLTQRLAVSLSKEWVIDAYGDVTMEYRSKVPSEIEIAVDDFKANTLEGENEKEIVDSFVAMVTDKENDELKRQKFGVGDYILSIVLGVVGIGTLLSGVGVAILLFVGGYIYYRKKVIKKRKVEIGEKYENYKDNGIQLIKAILAEVVDYRREFKANDNKFDESLNYIKGLSEHEYVCNHYSKARAILR